MSRFTGRLTCVCALLCAAGAGLAAEVPRVERMRFDATAWPSASDATLETLRGGFMFAGNLAISFGFVRSVTINGDLVQQIRFSLPDLSRITVDQAKMVSDALAQAGIVQNGAGNSVPVSGTASNGTAGSGVVSGPSGGSAPVSNVPVTNVPATSVPTATVPVASPPVSVSTPTITPSGAGLSTATIIQNSLSNQILQSLTVIDTSANSLGILRSINLQGTLRDALLGAMGRQ